MYLFKKARNSEAHVVLVVVVGVVVVVLDCFIWLEPVASQPTNQPTNNTILWWWYRTHSNGKNGDYIYDDFIMVFGIVIYIHLFLLCVFFVVLFFRLFVALFLLLNCSHWRISRYVFCNLKYSSVIFVHAIVGLLIFHVTWPLNRLTAPLSEVNL